ncbi:MAG: TAT-variant-translocated molybdopterin oxidoreductase, partial [Candidatus Binatia bacterium]
MAERQRLDLAAIRARLDTAAGPEYWRGLEELADSESFREFLHGEFPDDAPAWLDPVSRRQFFSLMGASLALAGLSGCTRQPPETILPYVKQPEEIVPGKPLFFATAVTLRGFANGVLVESHEGRPTKIEGNPDHPASLGASDVFGQGAVLDFWDPDRSQTVTHAGRIRPFAAFREAVRAAMDGQRSNEGARLRILTETVTSPTLARQLRDVQKQLPDAKWIQYDAVSRDSVRAGAGIAFGDIVETQYRFDKADVVLSLGADFTGPIPGNLRYVRDFVSRRRLRGERIDLNRLYTVETFPTNTGGLSDHRLALKPSEIEPFARAVAAAVGVAGMKAAPLPGELSKHATWVEKLVADLKAHRGACLVIPGEEQAASVHALAHAMNLALGAVGKTVILTEPVEVEPTIQIDALRQLTEEMNHGLVDVLLILGGNPVFTAPADLEIGRAFDKVGLRIHVGLYDDETAELCHWHVPQAHPLETWSDARAYDGTVTVMQPLIEPLYGGKSFHEVVSAIFTQQERSGYELVRETWKAKAGADFERLWRRTLHDGMMPGTALDAKSISLRGDWVSHLGEAIREGAAASRSEGLEIAFRADPTIFDGRSANNGWLQELSKPQTKLTWDNAAMVSPATAERLGLENEAVIELQLEGRSVEAPIWIQPGQAADCVTVHLGYGRRRTGRVGTGAGFDAYRIRTSAAPWSAVGLKITKTGKSHPLACTQTHHSMEGRHIIVSAPLEEYRAHPDFAQHEVHTPPAHETM